MDTTTIPAELLSTPISKWQLNLVTVLFVASMLGRAFSGLMRGGGVRGVLRSVWLGSATAPGAPAEPGSKAPAPLSRLNLLFALLAVGAVLGSGCARFSTTQTDLSYNENGKPLRQITTKATAGTFWESKSSLASFKATQTDKSQAASVGSLNQESSGTNAGISAAQFLGELIKAAK